MDALVLLCALLAPGELARQQADLAWLPPRAVILAQRDLANHTMWWATDQYNATCEPAGKIQWQQFLLAAYDYCEFWRILASASNPAYSLSDRWSWLCCARRSIGEERWLRQEFPVLPYWRLPPITYLPPSRE